MNPNVQTILEHMLDDALDILRFAADLNGADDLKTNRLYRKAIVMSILNIGELVKRLSHEFKLEHDVIPWKKISGMRDIAAHGYHAMENVIVWDVITHSIPELVQFLQQQLHNKENL
ncbi:MAG: DUF86 domain-containing protein [Oscillospiraceae bacterium]|nr:DUF86 domain-containing protein [Oscillospiraceae bacterium]